MAQGENQRYQAGQSAQYARHPEATDQPDGISNKLDDLFALHAKVGPLRGFESDVANGEMLVASLLIQSAVASEAYIKAWKLDHPGAAGNTSRSERVSFVVRVVILVEVLELAHGGQDFGLGFFIKSYNT